MSQPNIDTPAPITSREAITRAQAALFEQDAEGNADVIAYFDRLAIALAHVEDAKLYVDRIAATVLPITNA